MINLIRLIVDTNILVAAVRHNRGPSFALMQLMQLVQLVQLVRRGGGAMHCSD